VASVVEHTTRYGFYKITVSQGIMLDPRHPDEATVFALIVNPKELNLLRDQLKVVLPGLIEDAPADPAIVTRLAGIGQVQAYQPTALADISIPRADLALRTRVGGADGAGPDSPVSPARRDRPTLEQERSAPVPTPARSGSSPGRGSVAARGPGAELPGGAIPPPGDSRQRGPATAEQHAPASATPFAERKAAPEEEVVVLVWVCGPSR
jgi:hypothetical protein